MSSNGSSQKGLCRLQGKVAIITGGAGGFGERIAHTFVQEGARVVIADFNAKAGAKVEQDLQSAHGKDAAIFHETNVTQKPSWEKLHERTLKEFGKIDILINNAGTTYPKKPSHTVTDDEWEKVINVNMKSIYLSTAVIMPYFVEQKAGVVLNTSSVGGIRVKNGLVKLSLIRVTFVLTRSSRSGMVPRRHSSTR